MKFDMWSTEREKAAIEPETGLKILADEWTNQGGGTKYLLKAWKPRAKNPMCNFSFKTAEARNEYVAKLIEDAKAEIAAKLRRLEERKGSPEALEAIQIGTIFHHSWGYDQTNCDYYQVVAKSGRTVTIRQICSKLIEKDGYSPMAGEAIPVADAFVENEPELTKRIQFSQGRAFLSFEFGWCDFWDGKPKYVSWYA